VPEGFDDGYAIAADDAPPPPPPPPPPIPGRRPGAASSVPATGGFKDSTVKGAGGFRWNWKAALNILIGVGIIGFGIFEFGVLGRREAAAALTGETVRIRGRRSGLTALIYAIGGKVAVLGFFVVVGIIFIGGALAVMFGKAAGDTES
jgi:hypothetical protein